MVHIGKLIKEQLDKKKMSVSQFAQKINTNRNNIYNIFTRQSIDTQLLFTISIVLEHNFFQYYNPVPKNSAIDFSQEISPETLKKWLTQQFSLLHKKIDKLKMIRK